MKAASQIADHYQLNERDYFIVVSAAWFHDAGYYVDYSDHESRGADLAATFLHGQGVEEAVIDEIRQCILATRMPQAPHNLLQQIVCDADLFHLGTSEFSEKNKLMRKEAELKKGLAINKDEWRLGTIRLLESHHYFTSYCQLLLNDTKQENLNRLKGKAEEKKKKPPVNWLSRPLPNRRFLLHLPLLCLQNRFLRPLIPLNLQKKKTGINDPTAASRPCFALPATTISA